MKKFALVLFLAACFFPFLYGQKTRFGQEGPKAKAGVDYPVKVHIAALHIRSNCSVFGPGVHVQEPSCRDVLYVNAEIDGKKLELMGDWAWFPGFYQLPLSTGDCQARLLKDAPKMSVSPLYREYELVLPDRTIWRCTVTGFSE